MIRMLAPFFVIAIVLFFPVAAMAQPAPIGTVIEVEGAQALVMRAAEQGKAYPVKPDDAVYMNDVLQTGADGRMLVLLLDDSRFTLGENARFKIDEYVYDDENDSGNKARYNVLQGVFLYASGMIAKKENPDIKISIPYGSIGIRGTTVWGGLLDEEYSVFVDDGEVTVETNRGRVRVAKGEGTAIRNANAIPERAKVWGEQKATRARNTIGLKNVAQVKERVALQQKNHAAMVAQHRAAMRAQRQGTPPVSRDGSTREMRPFHQKPSEPVAPKLKNRIEEKIQEKREIRGDGSAPQVPPAAMPSAPLKQDTLPADPARRQEAIERQMLQKRAPAPARQKQRDPFQ